MGQSGLKMMARLVGLSLFFTSLIYFIPAYADEADSQPEISKWKMITSPQMLYTSYSGTTSREQLVSAGIALDAQYLERGGLSVSMASTQLTQKASAPATASSTLNQTEGSLSGRLHFTPDYLSGQLTLRTDILRADNNDASNETNNVNVIAPQLAYLNFAKSFYLDLGYARSIYGESVNGNGSLTVTQWTPTVGFAFNDGGDWLQLRAYNITPSNPARAQNYASTNAGELKWTHYFYPDGLMPEQIHVGALFGKRIYAVDGTSIYNLADLQQGSASLGVQWLVAQDTHLFVQAGQSLYNSGSGGNYAGSYAYFSLISQW